MVGGSLGDTNPNRELIKEGKITKVSARDGSHLERYLFLVLHFFALALETIEYIYSVNQNSPPPRGYLTFLIFFTNG